MTENMSVCPSAGLSLIVFLHMDIWPPDKDAVAYVSALDVRLDGIRVTVMDVKCCFSEVILFWNNKCTKDANYTFHDFLYLTYSASQN